MDGPDESVSIATHVNEPTEISPPQQIDSLLPYPVTEVPAQTFVHLESFWILRKDLKILPQLSSEKEHALALAASSLSAGISLASALATAPDGWKNHPVMFGIALAGFIVALFAFGYYYRDRKAYLSHIDEIIKDQKCGQVRHTRS